MTRESLVNKITSWQFVEMSELLPEYWPVAREGGSPLVAQKSLMTLIHGCSALHSMWGMLGTHHSEAIRELMAYSVCISRAKQDYEGRACAQYDTGGTQQLPTTGSGQQ